MRQGAAAGLRFQLSGGATRLHVFMIPCLLPHVPCGPWASLQSVQESQEQSAGLQTGGADAQLSARHSSARGLHARRRSRVLPYSCRRDERAAVEVSTAAPRGAQLVRNRSRWETVLPADRTLCLVFSLKQTKATPTHVRKSSRPGITTPRVGAQAFTRAGDRLPPARLGECSVHRRQLRVRGSRL